MVALDLALENQDLALNYWQYIDRIGFAIFISQIDIIT